MGEPRLSIIIISILIIGLFSIGFIGFYSSGSSKYSVDSYNSSTFDYITDISDNLSEDAFSTKNSTEGLGSSIDSENDVFGSFFAQAWTALKTTGSSLDSTEKLINGASENVPLMNNTFKNALKTFLIGSSIVIIIIAIFLHFVKQSNRL